MSTKYNVVIRVLRPYARRLPTSSQLSRQGVWNTLKDLQFSGEFDSDKSLLEKLHQDNSWFSFPGIAEKHEKQLSSDERWLVPLKYSILIVSIRGRDRKEVIERTARQGGRSDKEYRVILQSLGKRDVLEHSGEIRPVGLVSTHGIQTSPKKRVYTFQGYTFTLPDAVYIMNPNIQYKFHRTLSGKMESNQILSDILLFTVNRVD